MNKAFRIAIKAVKIVCWIIVFYAAVCIGTGIRAYVDTKDYVNDNVQVCSYNVNTVVDDITEIVTNGI